jgi:hypothetical protein
MMHGEGGDLQARQITFGIFFRREKAPDTMAMSRVD